MASYIGIILPVKSVILYLYVIVFWGGGIEGSEWGREGNRLRFSSEP